MYPASKKILKIVIPFSLGILILFFVYSRTSAADRQTILENIVNADIFWVSLSILIGILSHVSRAIRWNLLINPLGYTSKISTNFFIVMIGYFANIGIPRSGEFLRATALTTYGGVPFEKGFGTIITERIIDLIMLLLIIASALFMQTHFILGYLKQYGFGLIFGITILLIGIIGLVAFLKLIKRAKQGYLFKIKAFLNGILEGVSSILRMKNKWGFFFHTLFIWGCYIGMFWAIKFAIPGTAELNLSQLLVAFVAGAFAMIVFPGGLGGYPVFVSAALSLYGILPTSGDAFGWVIWIAQTLMIILFGIISFILLPLLNQNQ